MSAPAPSSAIQKPDYLVPGTLVGAYEVLDLVGRGGFGTLYKVARDGLVFALKISNVSGQDLAAEDDFEGRSRREMAALLSLRHPNIVEVLGFERWPSPRTGHLYIVMDYVEGLHLLEWRRKQTPSLRSIVQVFRKLSLAVAEMHRLELFHRDLKSDNILIRSSDGEPIIVDFGVSRPRSSHTVTRQHHVVGTYSHLTPEFCAHCRSEAFIKGTKRFVLKPTVEIHTLGFMLYQAVTGRAPYTVDANDFPSVLLVISETIPQPPIVLNPYVPEALNALIIRLLAKDPAARPQSGTALAEEFEALLATTEALWDAPLDVPFTRVRPSPVLAPDPREDEPTRLLSFTPGPAPALEEADQDDAKPPVTVSLAPKGAIAAEGQPPASGFVPPADEAPAFQETAKPQAQVAAPNAQLAAAQMRLGGMVSQPRKFGTGVWLAIGICLFFALVISLVAIGGKDDRPRPQSLISSLEKQPTPVFETSAPYIPTNQAGGAQPQTLTNSVRSDARPSVPGLPKSSRIEPEAPSWLHRPRKVESPRKRLSTRGQKLGIPLGTHLHARLKTNLDSRTVGLGTTEATLVRPAIVNGLVVLPAQTRLFGQARSSGDRFTVTFDRLRLPNDAEFGFRGRAEDPSDGNKPGLPWTRRNLGERRQEAGLASKVAKGTARQLLSQVTGDTGRDVAREAGETALDGSPEEALGSNDEIFLDAGAEFGVFVEESF